MTLVFYLPTGATQLALIIVESLQPTEFIIKGDKKNCYFNLIVDDIETVHQLFKKNGELILRLMNLME